jgi:N-acetylglucosamine kinase-like BadF-type ATPase
VGVIGVDGGNTKTELLAATIEGEPLAYVRGPGSNAHGLGAHGCVAVIAGLVERARMSLPADHGTFFLCGADVPDDVEGLTDELAARRWTRAVTVDNDTFALLRAGTAAPDAVAVVCGAGINCVGRTSDGRLARYPALGWETGDWGGSELLGREALFRAARAEDGRGEATVLVDLLREHFGTVTAAELGEEIHYRRVREQRLGEIAPAVVDAAAGGDAVAARLVERLAEEIVLLALKALRDLELVGHPAEVVLGGGMLRGGRGRLHDEVLDRLRSRAPEVNVVVASDPPVLGATLAALDAVGASPHAEERLRAAVRDGLVAEHVA